MIHFCYFCLVLLCFHARLFVVALWSPAGKGLTSWLSFVMSKCDAVTFLLVSMGQVCCLIVSIPDISYFHKFYHTNIQLSIPCIKCDLVEL